MDEFTTLLVAKADSPLVNIIKTRYLVHANEAAIAFALTIQPDIILIDCDTCGIDSFALCRELRTHPELESTRVVLFSTFLTRPCDRAQALRCGASELLLPQCDTNHLQPTLFAIMSAARMPLPLSDPSFFLLEAEYLKESHSYLLSACHDLRKNVIAMSSVANEEAQLRRSIEAKLNHTERLESIGRVATAIAHDFNNILSGIVGFAEIGIHLADAPSSCTTRFDSILKTGRRASHLVGSILDFSRQHEQPQEPFDVPEAITETLEILRATIPPAVHITENHFLPLPRILGEKSQFQNMLTNLVINASHAIGNAPGQVVISTDFSPPIADHLEQNPDLEARLYVKVKVIDSGAGISAEHLEQIFNAFFTTKTPGAGTGLGLSLAAGIVKLWGGAICVDSTPGKGSTFTLYFPPAQLSIPSEPVHTEAVPQGNGERILFVDDEEILGLVISESLSSLGYSASFAPTPEVALEKHRRERFDLVITDLSMPRMNGLELARSLWDRHPQQRVILTTGHAGKLTPEAVYALGFAGLLLKPFKTAALANLLQKALV